MWLALGLVDSKGLIQPLLFSRSWQGVRALLRTCFSRINSSRIANHVRLKIASSGPKLSSSMCSFVSKQAMVKSSSKFALSYRHALRKTAQRWHKRPKNCSITTLFESITRFLPRCCWLSKPLHVGTILSIGSVPSAGPMYALSAMMGQYGSSWRAISTGVIWRYST